MSRPKKPLPAHARRVFKGVIFEVWQWEQKMFDGSVQTFERLKRPNTAVVIPTVGNKILLQLQEQPHSPRPFASFPGGRIEEGEDPLVGAKRELIEETGYKSDDWFLWRELDPVSKIEWTIYSYIARDCRKTGEPKLDAGEKITTRLIDFEEFLTLADDPSFYEKELAGTLLRARYDPRARRELQQLLFGKK